MRKSTVLLILTGLMSSWCFAKEDIDRAKPKTQAEWTIVCYIQADNNLEPYAEYNIQDMQRVGSTNNVNILVQWDQPNNNKTWRYYIQKGKRLDAGSLNQEMGINPEQEVGDMMEWAVANYPAKKYMLVLWNHGNGVSDLNKNLKKQFINGWLQIPGMPKPLANNRGILYDDTQGTFLTNQGLTRVCNRIKTLLGKNIDVVAMDACLMAMIEVAYDLKDSTDVFVGSEETVAGEGFPYSKFLAPLIKKPTTFAAKDLASTIVSSYKDYYKKEDEWTLSAFDISTLSPLCASLNTVVDEVKNCYTKNATTTKKMLTNAQSKATAFYVADYLDLNSFYTELTNAAKKSKTTAFNTTQLQAAIQRAQNAIATTVFTHVEDSAYKNVKGVSIYFPQSKTIDRTYPLTDFAQDTKWLSLLQLLGKK